MKKASTGSDFSAALHERWAALRWRIADRRKLAEERLAETPDRLRAALPPAPPWLELAMLRARWRLEEWRCRAGLWWTRRIEPGAAWLAAFAARSAQHLEGARAWALHKLRPWLWRTADYLHRRAEAAATRRAALATRIADLRQRHLDPVVHAVEERLTETPTLAAVGQAARRSGLNWMHGAVACTVLALMGWAIWRNIPAGLPAISDEEIAMITAFRSHTPAMDPTAWLRAIESPPPAMNPR
jgi:hypothetical protein